MDVTWNDSKAKQIATSVGLISSNGPHGHNIMAAEWTHQVSNSPALLMVNVNNGDATAENIVASRRFGVSIAAEGQALLASIAGGSTGKQVDKIAVAKAMGFAFYQAKKTSVLMVEGAAMNAECVLVESRQMGDRMMFLGEIAELSADEGKKPLLYQQGKYWELGGRMERPPASIIEEIQKLKEKYRKRREEPPVEAKLKA